MFALKVKINKTLVENVELQKLKIQIIGLSIQ